ncbi:hypothetical protein PYW07_008560 [Mythimna separata]|uniref:Uncharacterized protein n=1 Tax=Mythimna separata TaxID=271217 RepID=A0AAD8DNT4_MYTSE|nr:hypothetical protein PYW07_008560 [Mythimna separata]
MEYQSYTILELNQARDTFIRRVAIFAKYVENLKNVLKKHTDVGRVQLKELKLRMDKIEPLYNKFDEVATRIDKTSGYTERDCFEEMYFRSMAIAMDILDEHDIKIKH